MISTLAGAGAAALAYGFFASRPPMQVLVGLRPIDEVVSPFYQAAAFASFGHLAAQTGSRLWLRDWPSALPALALLTATSGIAVARLSGWIPLSGHAVFLSSALVMAAAGSDEEPLAGGAYAAAGLLVTAVHKVRWGDLSGFVASSALGLVLGAAACRLTPRPAR
jgi:hypothetical protein